MHQRVGSDPGFAVPDIAVQCGDSIGGGSRAGRRGCRPLWNHHIERQYLVQRIRGHSQHVGAFQSGRGKVSLLAHSRRRRSGQKHDGHARWAAGARGEWRRQGRSRRHPLRARGVAQYGSQCKHLIGALERAMRITRGRAAATAVLLFSFTLTATAPAQTPPAHPEISKETREKMAALHEQMASCLRSDKSLAQCHSEMAKSCKEQLGEGCPMMGMRHGGADPHHHMQPMGATTK